MTEHSANSAQARRRRAAWVLPLVGFGLAAPLLMGLAGARVNTTPSLAYGVYWDVADPVTRGAHVEFCPPSRHPAMVVALARGHLQKGSCPGGVVPFLKRVAGLPGDRISVRPEGVWVNGQRLPNSERSGAPMPPMQLVDYVLPDDELLLMSPMTNQSLDGRYYGPVARKSIHTVVRPVLTWSP